MCAKKKLPAELQAIDTTKDLETFLKQFDFTGLIMGHTRSVYCYGKNDVEMIVSGNSYAPSDQTSGRNLRIRCCTGAAWEQKIGFVEDDGTVWCSTMKAQLMTEQRWDYSSRPYREYTYPNAVKSWELSPWRICHSIDCGITQLQRDEEMLDILQDLNPYARDFVEDNMVNPMVYFMAPQLEVLAKAGYTFTKQFMAKELRRLEPHTVELFNRLTQPGNSPKEIFKTSKAVYSSLKEEQDLHIWDSFRRMDKTGVIPQDSIKLAYDSGALTPRILEDMRSVLSRTYKGKPVFTWETLQNYLNRIDLNEAIGRVEGLQILSDYLMMCKQLDIEPKIDGDSLKREHDVCARLCRQQVYDEKAAQRMAEACKDLQQYNYEEGDFLIRGFTDANDLLDEARQQHSCLACYCTAIEKRERLVFALRQTAQPEKSYATVELSTDGKTVRQVYMAYNTPLRSREAREFIERWKRVLTDRGLAS